MEKCLRLGMLLFVGLTVVACSKQIAVLRVEPSGEPMLEVRQYFIFGGIGQVRLIDAAEVCGSARDVTRVEGEQTAIDGLIAAVTLGILTPRTARVFCVK